MSSGLEQNVKSNVRFQTSFPNTRQVLLKVSMLGYSFQRCEIGAALLQTYRTQQICKPFPARRLPEVRLIDCQTLLLLMIHKS